MEGVLRLNIFEKHLLKLGYENYLKNGISYTEFHPNNPKETLYYSDAAEYLEESEHLLVHSNNIATRPVNIFNSDSLIRYELTDKGLLEAKIMYEN